MKESLLKHNSTQPNSCNTCWYLEVLGKYQQIGQIASIGFNEILQWMVASNKFSE